MAGKTLSRGDKVTLRGQHGQWEVIGPPDSEGTFHAASGSGGPQGRSVISAHVVDVIEVHGTKLKAVPSKKAATSVKKKTPKKTAKKKNAAKSNGK